MKNRRDSFAFNVYGIGQTQGPVTRPSIINIQYKMRRPNYNNNYQHHHHHHDHHDHHDHRQQQEQQYNNYRIIEPEKPNYINLLWLLTIILMTAKNIIATEDVTPDICDGIQCPPYNDIKCPSDSEVREMDPVEFSSVKLRNESNVSMDDEIFVPCCLAKKCLCKTCYIPDCKKSDEVVVEIYPEFMQRPGNCCGKYKCQTEPNCTELYTTDNYWLTNCQRCKCYAGQRLCHQSCDEELNKKSGVCHSKTLNTFFEHGDTWKEGCLECECVNGEPNCVIAFCRKVDCPPDRQIKGRCCLKCSDIKGDDNQENNDSDDSKEADNDDDTEYDNNYDDIDDEEDGMEEVNGVNGVNGSNEMDEESNITLEPLRASSNEHNDDPIPSIEWDKSSSSSISSTTDDRMTPTDRPCMMDNSCPPKDDGIQPDNNDLYPQVVELMHYNRHSDLLYTIIAILSIIVVILSAWNIHLKAKQRSYRPVSHFDDNFNRMTLNIKKVNDYV